jgi:hypothetical protein
VVPKPAWANSLQNPISKNTHHKKGLVEWLKVKALSSNPSTPNKPTTNSMAGRKRLIHKSLGPAR